MESSKEEQNSLCMNLIFVEEWLTCYSLGDRDKWFGGAKHSRLPSARRREQWRTKAQIVFIFPTFGLSL